MYELKIYPSCVVVGIKDKIVFFSSDGTAVLHEITFPQKQTSIEDIKVNNQPNQPANVATFAYCLSSKVLAVSLSDKTVRCYQISIGEGGSWCSAPLGDTIPTARTIVCMKFAPKHGVLIGSDKSDCFEFELLGKSEQRSKWILGHMSLILDLAISEDERFIVTCDRDEKIKISSYPDCHNIVNYCLGHKEYVCGLEIIEPDRLISLSGDGSLVLWNFIQGNELCKLLFDDPVVGLSVQKNIKCEGFMCVAMSTVQNKIHLALVECSGPSSSRYESLTIDESLIILSLALNASLQLVLLVIEKDSKRAKLKVYDLQYAPGGRYYTESVDHPLSKNFENRFKEDTIEQVRDYSTLFKHSIDNLTDYFERKKQKMTAKKSK
uniref:tRNA (guanine-N(7)-)-methyltransferase non-catalytic subunit wuho n=1 Tax=Anopheles farauti TaxID=69004 RepID=A0A182QIJ6_9DIPT